MEMERFSYRAGEKKNERWHWCLIWRKPMSELAFHLCALGRRIAMFPETITCAMRVLRGSEASTVRRMCGGAALDHHGDSPVVEMELLVAAHCAAGRSD